MLYVHTEPQGSNEFQILAKSAIGLQGLGVVFRLLYFNFLLSDLLNSQKIIFLYIGLKETGGFVSV